jgi:hypothetical protein
LRPAVLPSHTARRFRITRTVPLKDRSRPRSLRRAIRPSALRTPMDRRPPALPGSHPRTELPASSRNPIRNAGDHPRIGHSRLRFFSAHRCVASLRSRPVSRAPAFRCPGLQAVPSVQSGAAGNRPAHLVGYLAPLLALSHRRLSAGCHPRPLPGTFRCGSDVGHGIAPAFLTRHPRLSRSHRVPRRGHMWAVPGTVPRGDRSRVPHPPCPSGEWNNHK